MLLADKVSGLVVACAILAALVEAGLSDAEIAALVESGVLR